ncbi:hypothetical protein M527_04805 [Sphingobium indicum IP26]|nr:hypothetical protein M527_02920 [Sphingobium indicum IP26]EPR11408.1 hypothetical protein M527_04805 [Sphingobium indicum IP26]
MQDELVIFLQRTGISFSQRGKRQVVRHLKMGSGTGFRCGIEKQHRLVHAYDGTP